MAIHKLSHQKIKNAKPGKYENGGGLRLVVTTSGSKKWVLRFTILGKRREMGLGSYPDIQLAAARLKATEFRNQASTETDPNTSKLSYCRFEFIRTKPRVIASLCE